MVHIVPRGMQAQGKGAVSVDELMQIKVIYAEAGFDCVSLVPPSASLAQCVQLAIEHGLNEASRQLGVPKHHLHALASAPLVKADDSPVPVEEWVNHNFIVVKMKQDKKEEGLLGKYRKQHAFLETMMRMGIQDLGVSTPKKADDDVQNRQKELHLMKDTTSEAKLIDVKTKVIALEAENQTLKYKVTALEEENQTLKYRVTALEEELQMVQEENGKLKGELQMVKGELQMVKGELQVVQKKIAQLSGMDLVMVRKMLEACRTKCRNFLSQRNVHIPHDWNELICDAICIGVLKEAGLTIGLPATAYGKKSQQQKGYEAAHTIMECPEAYATIVCKMDGHQREQMMNVFEFVFGSKAEDLAFEDI